MCATAGPRTVHLMAHRPSSERFNGSTAVVTGGASGIGAALVHELVRQGCHVVVVDLRPPEPLDSLPSSGVQFIAMDVRDAAAIDSLAADVVQDRGRIDLWFNNAGIVFGGESHLLRTDHWNEVISVNLEGVINGVVAAYPRMVSAGGGQIVNTASAAGLVPAVFVPAYTASKHAVVGLSRALRAEGTAHGVKVSVLCPGAVDTPILDAEPPANLPVEGAGLSGREYMGLARLRLASPESVARAALRGVQRNRAVIVTGSARAAWWIDRVSPSIIDRSNASLAKRVRQVLHGSA